MGAPYVAGPANLQIKNARLCENCCLIQPGSAIGRYARTETGACVSHVPLVAPGDYFLRRSHLGLLLLSCTVL